MCNTVFVQADKRAPNGGARWRLVDHTRKVRTAWAAGTIVDNPDVVRTLRRAVELADRKKFNSHRHTVDGDWLIIKAL